MRNIVLVLLGFLELIESHNIPSAIDLEKDEFEIELEHLLDDYVREREFGKIGPFSNQTYQLHAGEESQHIICSICRAIANNIIKTRKSGATRDTMYEYLQELCPPYGFNSRKTCYGFLDINIDTILYIIDNTKDIDGLWVCSVVLSEYQCEAPDSEDWVINVKPGYSVPTIQPVSSDYVRILHISDIHYDPYYKFNSNTACSEIVCCDSDPDSLVNFSDLAGYWGDYRTCDLPWYTVVNAFNHIKRNHNFSYVYFTGDLLHHRTWLTTKDNVKSDLRRIHELFDATFNGARIFPVLGNHDTHPADLFAPEGVDSAVSSQWLFDFFAEEWSNWLPPYTQETIRKGGYYTVKVNNKFRIIALNSNVCFEYNLWLIYDDIDPYGQLQWLNEVLSEAEDNKENVHILGHVPTGTIECYSTWAREYRKIINRFANTIKASFTGHTHMSEMELFYNISDPSTPVHIEFNGGSLTTFPNVNPNYFVHHINAESREVVDSEQYIYNLTAANLNGPSKEPEWYKLYSFKNVYGLKDMSLHSLSDLIRGMAANKTLAQLYYKNKYKNSDAVLKQGCNDDCLLQNLCRAVSSWSPDKTQCNILEGIWNKTTH